MMREHLRALEAIACKAGCLIAKMRADGTAISLKADGSPVTDADRYAEDAILRGLAGLDPGTPVIAEERCCDAAAVTDAGARFYLVDALDGTKEFISGRDDFTVNIALVEDGVPKLGVVVAPARGTLFSGAGGAASRAAVGADGSIAGRVDIRSRHRAQGLVAVVSASHLSGATRGYLDRLAIKDRVSIGSSLKFCLLAAGEADVYPRHGRTMQWDTAAGDAILRNAGGAVLTLDGAALRYGARANAAHPYENPAFIAFATEELADICAGADDAAGRTV